ncbi:MAG: ABC transporter ATP-binding protein [Phycisphaerales bacterium]|nr:ABC transporter ATP-binding protein [Phycisphaerales bacterium]
MVAQTPNDALVRCRNLAHEYGEGEARVFALRGLDLDIYAGQLTLLVGPSGCGKTTLLSIIAGILRASHGDVTVLDTALQTLSGSEKTEFRRKNVGFVFQQYNLLPELTAVENVAVPLIVAGERRSVALARGRELLASLNMGHRANARPQKLSGGEQQRVAIARALVHHPRLLVCDEPTSALDERTGHAIMELLYGVAVDPERAVLVVTHDSRVFAFGDRTAYLNDGQVVRVEARTGPRPAIAPLAKQPTP